MSTTRWMATVSFTITLIGLTACDRGFVLPGSDGQPLSDPAAQRAILALARRAFDVYATERRVIEAPASLPAFLRQRRGVFISTMRGGAPRTCMGTLFPTQPNLALEIIENAVASAGRDRRFPPVKPEELPRLTLIVSLVDPPRPISEPAARALDPARDGLAVKCGDRYGVVLSGETPHPEKMLAWGRIRAGARPGAAVQWFRIDDVRFMESPSK